MHKAHIHPKVFKQPQLHDTSNMSSAKRVSFNTEVTLKCFSRQHRIGNDNKSVTITTTLETPLDSVNCAKIPVNLDDRISAFSKKLRCKLTSLKLQRSDSRKPKKNRLAVLVV
ncbi:hypothetical protein DSO57_1026931 [Entomophthora muscae]|uniref:Uncharacterized protein n=1 Tax=Entomophthora muscae TaxID=34485 RepID=A0ACC2RT22_9FUNG|nr:hypothetical protein DSO57_1026931 [Entomophthora muscae]